MAGGEDGAAEKNGCLRVQHPKAIMHLWPGVGPEVLRPAREGGHRHWPPGSRRSEDVLPAVCGVGGQPLSTYHRAWAPRPPTRLTPTDSGRRGSESYALGCDKGCHPLLPQDT